MLHPHRVYSTYVAVNAVRMQVWNLASPPLPPHHGCTGALGVWCLERLVELKPVLVSWNVPQHNLQHTIRTSQYTMLYTDQCHTVVQAIFYTQTFVCPGVGTCSCFKQYVTHCDTSDRCTRPAPAVEEGFINSLCLYVRTYIHTDMCSLYQDKNIT